MPEIDEVVCPRCHAPLAVRVDRDRWRVTCMSCENSFDLAEAVAGRLPNGGVRHERPPDRKRRLMPTG